MSRLSEVLRLFQLSLIGVGEPPERHGLPEQDPGRRPQVDPAVTVRIAWSLRSPRRIRRRAAPEHGDHGDATARDEYDAEDDVHDEHVPLDGAGDASEDAAGVPPGL